MQITIVYIHGDLLSAGRCAHRSLCITVLVHGHKGFEAGSRSDRPLPELRNLRCKEVGGSAKGPS